MRLLVVLPLLALLQHVMADKNIESVSSTKRLSVTTPTTTTKKATTTTSLVRTTTSSRAATTQTTTKKPISPTTTSTTTEMPSFFSSIFQRMKNYSYLRTNTKSLHPECFEGDLRSPIDLEIQKAEVTEFPPLKLTGLDVIVDGITVKDDNFTEILFISDSNKQKVTLSSGGLDEIYYLREIQWAAEYTKTLPFSHTINGGHQSSEIHFIFTRKYYNMTNTKLEDGDVVNVAVFLDIVQEPKDNMTSLSLDKPIIEKDSVTNTYHFNIPLRNLFPTDLTSFFRYKGSMVRPPCRQGVLWNILTEPIVVSHEEYVNYIQTPFKPFHEKIYDFSRFVEDFPTNDNRVVYLNKQKTNDVVVVAEKVTFEHGWIINVSLTFTLVFVVLGSCLFIKFTQPKDVMSFDNIAME